MKHFIIVIIGIFVLSGCDATIETQVSIKDILESKSKFIAGDLYVEVSSCHDYKDSRKPSESLLKTQNIIPTVFKDAKYIECFSKEFDSLAHFSIPIALDKTLDEKMVSNEHINVLSNDTTLLGIGIPQLLKSNIENAKSSGSGKLNLKVNFEMHNDTNTKFKFGVLASYVNNKPYVHNFLTIDSGETFKFTLSDVSVSKALEDQAVTVLFHSEKKHKNKIDSSSVKDIEAKINAMPLPSKKKAYISSIIKNGSSGHNYPMGAMPAGMASGLDIEVIAEYVANGMKGDAPTSFSACSACHGVDGNGMNGMSPNLKVLPIFNSTENLDKNSKDKIITSTPKEHIIVAPSMNKVETIQDNKPIKVDKVSQKNNHYANDMTIINDGLEGIKVLLEGNGESCSLRMTLFQEVLDSNCKHLTNSKKVRIICSPNKKICKTEQEIFDFISK